MSNMSNREVTRGHSLHSAYLHVWPLTFFNITAGVCCSDNCSIHILSILLIVWCNLFGTLPNRFLCPNALFRLFSVSNSHLNKFLFVLYLHSILDCPEENMHIYSYLNIKIDAYRRRWLMCAHYVCWDEYKQGPLQCIGGVSWLSGWSLTKPWLVRLTYGGR